MGDTTNTDIMNTNDENLNQENMIENKIEIFNDLDDIKEQIPEGIYIKLCNKIQSLIKENCKLQNQIKYGCSCGNCYYSSEDEYQDSSEEQEEGPGPVEESEQEITEIYNNMSLDEILDYNEDIHLFLFEYECKCDLENKVLDKECFYYKERLYNCKLFQYKCNNGFELLLNIFEKQDKEFTTEPIYFDINENKKNEIILNIKFLLEFLGNIDNLRLIDISERRRYRMIISFVIYDYLFKNFSFCLQYLKFLKTMSERINNFINEVEGYSLLALEYNIDSNKWKEIINNKIIEHENTNIEIETHE